MKHVNPIARSCTKGVYQQEKSLKKTWLSYMDLKKILRQLIIKCKTLYLAVKKYTFLNQTQQVVTLCIFCVLVQRQHNNKIIKDNVLKIL